MGILAGAIPGDACHPEGGSLDRAYIAAVPEMYATVTRTRKVHKIAEKMGIERHGKDRVSAIAKTTNSRKGRRQL